MPASETILHQKRTSIADRSHLQQQTVETNCKMNPASWIAQLQGLCELLLFYKVYASAIVLPLLQ
jgi:hypothetical protein